MHRSKVTMVLSLAMLVLVVLLGAPTAGAAPDKASKNDSNVLSFPDKRSKTESTVINIGHRGASGYVPEHAIPAYDLALEQGADYIEIDLQMTADGVLVAMHDDTLDRTAVAPEGVPEEYCTEGRRGRAPDSGRRRRTGRGRGLMKGPKATGGGQGRLL